MMAPGGDSLPIRQSDSGPPDPIVAECRACRSSMAPLYVGWDNRRYWRCTNGACYMADPAEWIPDAKISTYLKGE